MGITSDLRAPYDKQWHALVDNSFVMEMAAGTLPLEKFRFYIEQNLFYLPNYARMLGLALSHSETSLQQQRFMRALKQIVDVEIPANRDLLADVIDMGAEDLGGGIEPGPACLAYSNFLMATAAGGRPTDVMAAMLPCAWSYADIAAKYPDPEPHPVYQTWLSVFGGSSYQRYIEGLLVELDDLLDDGGHQDIDRLQQLFLTGIRMESAFWDMAHRGRGWT